MGVLTEGENPRKYWSVLKTRLKKEGSELAANCSSLKLLAIDGKMRLTDVVRNSRTKSASKKLQKLLEYFESEWSLKVKAKQILNKINL